MDTDKIFGKALYLALRDLSNKVIDPCKDRQLLINFKMFQIIDCYCQCPSIEVGFDITNLLPVWGRECGGAKPGEGLKKLLEKAGAPH